MIKYGRNIVTNDIKKMVASTNSVALLYNNGNLYMRGENSLSLWGTNDTSNKLDWTLVLTDVQDVWIGAYHTIALMNDGTYHCCGYARSLGVTGSNRLWEPYALLNNLISSTGGTVKKIECGVQGSQILMNNGDLYCIGFNNASCLAPSSFGTTLTTFVKSLTNVKDVSYNMNATMVITNDNLLRVVGTSDNYKLATTVNGSVLNVWTPRPLPTGYTYPISVYEAYRATYIYASSDSSGTSTALVGAGYNGYNQLGQPGTFSTPLMAYAAGATNIKITSFGTGWWPTAYSTMCTDGLQLYSAGQLGAAMGSATNKTTGFTAIPFEAGASASTVDEFCMAGSATTTGVTMMRSGNTVFACGVAAWLGTDHFNLVPVSLPE